jgi:DNA-binding response OmpR family regulator
MSYKVVVMDDEADIVRLVRIKLEKEGFEVITAFDGEEGVSKVLKENPEIMIVDVLMPKKDGYQVITEVKEKMGKNAPIAIMLSAKAEAKDITKGLTGGADDYITKPFSPRELIERINVALIKKGKTPVSFKK